MTKFLSVCASSARACAKSVFLLGLLCSLAVLSTQAQQSSGTILGSVKDASGASVPGATVTIRSVDTGQTRTSTTGDDGEYRVPALQAGHYDVQAEHSGFQTEKQQNINLDVSGNAVINFTMQVGTTQQEVVVTGESPLVNTTSSSVGGLVTEEKIADLPLNGRNYIDLSLMQSGVTKDANIGTGVGMSGTWYSSNGATPRSNFATLDGAPLVNEGGGTVSSELGTALGVDGIKEYEVITTSFSADYGMVMGSQLVIVSKGGTNQFHGDAFEYIRNSALDARNYFDQAKIPEFQRNNFGGAFGGPIKKDKTFFFAVFEGVKQNQGITANPKTLPAACHNFVTVGAAIHLVDPAGCGTGLTPSTSIAPVMLPLIALYTLPNKLVLGLNGTFTPVYSYTAPAISDEYYGQIRMDHNFSATDSMFGRYTIDDAANDTANINTNTTSAGAGFPQFRYRQASRYQFLTVAENHVFSSSLLNSARLSYSRTVYLTLNIFPDSLTGPQYSFVPGFPMGYIQIGGPTGSTTTLGGSANAGPPAVRLPQDVYTFADDLYWTRGKHALKFGALINRFTPALQTATKSGNVNFASIANFMQGFPATYAATLPQTDASRYYVYDTFGFYVQDDYRVNSRLTLNLGLRYEFNTTPREPGGKEYAIHNVLTDAAATHGPIFDNPSFYNFGPRVGFAYDVTGKGTTSLRGAFGVYYDVGNFGALLSQNEATLPPLSVAGSNSPAPGTLLTIPFTFTPSQIGHNLFTLDYNYKQPYSLQYNLTAEHQFWGGTALSVSYVGLRGIHLVNIREGNPIKPTSFINGQPFWEPNKFNPGAITSACAAAVGAGVSCRQNPNWTNIQWVSSGGDSMYNSLQVNVTKRLSHGLEFQAAYTWGRDLDDTEAAMAVTDCVSPGGTNIVNVYNPRLDWGPACFDVTNNFRFNLLYHFPNVRSEGILGKLANGWWMGNIVAVQSGYPFSPIPAANRSNDNGGGSQQDRISVNTAASIAAAGPCTPGANSSNFCAYPAIPFNKNTVNTGNPAQWFNPNMFSLQKPGTMGNAGRDMLRGPGLGTWDFSLVKDTKVGFLGEAGNIQFRAEFFNILNRSNFGMPSGVVFTGSPLDGVPATAGGTPTTSAGPFAEAPLSTVGNIAVTATSSRQLQFALKINF